MVCHRATSTLQRGFGARGTLSAPIAEGAARQLGVILEPLEVRGPEDLDVAFAAAQRSNAQALIAFDDPLTLAHRQRIATLAASSGLPAIYGFREFPDDGGLMSYGTDRVAEMRQAVSSYVDRILRGAAPGDLPVQKLTKFEFAINLQTAKAQGLEVPISLIAEAEIVIE